MTAKELLNELNDSGALSKLVEAGYVSKKVYFELSVSAEYERRKISPHALLMYNREGRLVECSRTALKKMDVLAHVAEDNGISERSLYRILQKLSKEV